MKKTLIALAAVAVSGAAFAQSSVTIGGTLEIAPFNTSESTVGNTTTKLSRTAQGNTWSTNVLSISGTEDLGGGLRASFVLISDSGQGSTTNSGIGNRERTLAVAGDFGTVRFGRFVPAAIAGYHGLSGAGSATMAGSIYGLITGGTGAAPNVIHGQPLAAANMERQDNLLQYTSPNFSGFTVNVNYGTASSDVEGTVGEDRRRQTGLHLGYTAGPLSLGIAVNRLSLNTEGAATDGGILIPANSSAKSSVNWVAGSYDFGVARVFAAHATRDASLNGGEFVDAKVTSLGVSVPLDAITLRASVYRGTDKRSSAADDNFKLSGYQVSASYALSKRTAVILATGTNDIKRDSGNTTGALRKLTSTSLTVNHTF